MKNSEESSGSSYDILKNEIEETFGKKINSSGDCLLLSEEIYSKISVTVNSNTLRRFFGLVKSHFLPSATTLDILSKYCGFSSFDEFMRLKNNVQGDKTDDYYSQSILNYLVSVFKNTPVKGYNDKTFFSVVNDTIIFLHRHPALIDKFQRAIAKTKNGQDFYFEQFINIDTLNSYYGDGLRYYLSEKSTTEAQIFGHSLLCLKNWFSENRDGVKKHHDELIQYRITKAFHPSLCGRYHATKLLYADTFGLPIEKLLIEMQQAHFAIKQKTDDSRLFPYFEFMIAPILFMTGHFEESLYYVNYSLHHYPQKHISITQSAYQTMNLIKALTLAKTGRKKEAVKLYRQVQPSKFDFLLKKTNTIQYLLLSQYLKKSNEKSDQQLKDLIEETGFIALNKLTVSNGLQQENGLSGKK